MSSFDIDVAIIGSGPSGIAAATALSNAGVNNITVYEREADIGGIPRHTHHPSFGLLVFKRPMSGPRFIAAILKRCPQIRFETNTTITAFREGGELDFATPSGIKTIRARHIILATGARELPRHPRLISGLRPVGATTTGALQQFIYLSKTKPFKRPVIVGTELVSFSALWTLRRAGIKAVAMIEQNSRITAYRPSQLFARLLGVPIYYNMAVSDIGGLAQLNQITIKSPKSGRQVIACDGVIFSGKFVGENTIAKASHLELSPDTQLPLVDQNWLSSDPAISVIGNATHPADMGDQCYREGLKAGSYVAGLLNGKAKPTADYIAIRHDKDIKMTTPNIVRPSADGFNISLHVSEHFTGSVRVTCGDQTVYQKSHRCMPARRITLKIARPCFTGTGGDQDISILLRRP